MLRWLLLCSCISTGAAVIPVRITKFRYSEGHLEAHRVSQQYRTHLRAGLALFVDWAKLSPTQLDSLALHPDRISQALVDFLDFAHSSGIPLWKARHAVLGVQSRWRALRHHIPRPWDAIRSWQAERVWSNRLPLLLEIMRAMFVVAVSWAGENPPGWPYMLPFAILLRVGFWCLLRPGEIIRLRRCDVRFVNRPRRPLAILAITHPKNRQFLGRAQFTILHSGRASAWLYWLCDGMEASLKLWPSSHHQFNTYFAAVLQRMGLGRMCMKVGSIRPGGATEFYMRHQSISFLKYQGRWKSDSSLSVHILFGLTSVVMSKRACSSLWQRRFAAHLGPLRVVGIFLRFAHDLAPSPCAAVRLSLRHGGCGLGSCGRIVGVAVAGD